MLSSSISKLGYQYYLNQTLDQCLDVSDLRKLILISKVKKRCYNTEELAKYNDLVAFESLKYLDKNSKSDVTVLKDNIIEWSKKNPECSTLPQWKRIVNDIKLKYNLDISLMRNEPNVVNLLLDIESRDSVKKNIRKLLIDIKRNPKEVASSTIRLESNEKLSSHLELKYNIIKEKVKDFNLSVKEYKRYSQNYNLSPEPVINIYKSGMKLKATDKDLGIQIKKNIYPLNKIDILAR